METRELHKITSITKTISSTSISFQDDGDALLESMICSTMAERVISQMIFIRRPGCVEDLWDEQLASLRQQIKSAKIAEFEKNYNFAIYTSLIACSVAQCWINSFGEDHFLSYTLEELARNVAHLLESDILRVKRAANRVIPWMIKSQGRKTDKFFALPAHEEESNV